MKQFIREHPWRLEIMPTLIIMFALISPLMCYRDAVAHTDAKYGLSPEHAWLLRYILFSMLMIMFWFVGPYYNHQWLQVEVDGKRFNKRVPVWGVVLATNGLMTLPECNGATWVVLSWLLIIPSTWFIQSWVERTRPFVPRQAASEEDTFNQITNLQRGERFYYREVKGSKWSIAILPFSVTYMMIAAWYLTGVRGIGIAVGVLIALLGVLRILSLGDMDGIVVISDKHIIIRKPLWRKIFIPMANIQDCVIRTIELHNPLDQNLFKIILGKDNPPPVEYRQIISITTTTGDRYFLNVKNPEAIHKLINTALAARQEKEVEG